MLKIMTLNLNFYIDKHGPWPQRARLIADVVRAAAPDIVAFQAVRCDPAEFEGQDQASQLSGQVEGYSQVAYKAAMENTDGSESGLAILSRLPVAELDSFKLTLRPALEDDNQRLVQRARFNLPGGPFYLFNAHFSWVEDQLRDNVADTLPHIQGVSDPALLVGDLNTPAGKGQLDRFQQAGWVDAWEKLNGSQTGYTFEAGKPSIRIDYAWANPALASHLKEIRLLGAEHNASNLHLSDHLGLLISLDL